MFALLGYILILACANWELRAFGSYRIAPGVVAPAGVFSIGLSFPLRASVHARYGVRAVVVAAAAAALLSALLYPRTLLTSVPTFVLAQVLATAAHAALIRRAPLGAVALASLLGLVADSLLYLRLVAQSQAQLPGQLLGKGAVALPPFALLWAAHRWRGPLLAIVGRLLGDARFFLQALLWALAWYSALRLAWPGDTLALHPLYRQLAGVPEGWWASLFLALGVATTPVLRQAYRRRPARSLAWAVWQAHALLWTGIGLSLFFAAPLTWVGGMVLAIGGIAEWVLWSPHLALFVRALRRGVGHARET